MKRNPLHFLWGTLLLLLCSINADAVVIIPINGTAVVCKNGTYSYNTPSPTTGISYHWTMTPSIGNFSTAYGPVTSVLWSVPGSTTLTLEGRNSANVLIELGTKAITVQALPQPVISTSYKVGCQNFQDDPIREGQPQAPKGPLFDDQGCPKVCEDSWVTYTATGLPGSNFIWTVSGGTAYPSGSTCLVHWGAIGMGNVSVKEITSPALCEGTRSICIEIIGKPHASFGAMPDTAKPDIDICLDDHVIFVDRSYATSTSPIVGWYWDFGDGHTYSSSTSTNPSHQYTTPGTFNVMLVVKNACNCTDTAYFKVNVRDKQGVRITCASVACENATSHYEVDPGISCGSYNWNVIGGNITSSAGSGIQVIWDNVDDDGFGYVMFDASPCAVDCPGTTTIKIPVIKQKGLIKGDAFVCPSGQYKYRLPAWPGTTYNWTVSNPSLCYLSHTDQPNEIVVHTNGVAGSVVLHCSYTNQLVGCGGTADFTINIYPPDNIVGDSTVCQESIASHTYQTGSGNYATWTLIAPDGSIITTSGTTVTPLFDQAGTYSLDAKGSFCVQDPLQIKVLGTPPIANTITGPDTICAGNGIPYEFTADSYLPGTIFEWSVTGGAIQGVNTGNKVAVVFSGPGPYRVYVHRKLTAFPYCAGKDIFKEVYTPRIVLAISGKDSVCSNTVNNYLSGYAGAETYTWTLSPQSAGSINNIGAPNITVTWNNATSVVAATLTLTVKRCGVTVSQNFPVKVMPTPVVQISSADSVCRDAPLSVGITSTWPVTSGTFQWSTGAVNPIVVVPPGSTGNTYVFNDISSGNISKDIDLLIVNPNGCNTTIAAHKSITVKPAPIAFITPLGPIGKCGVFSTPLTADLQAGVGITDSLAWYVAPSTVPVANCGLPLSCSTYNATNTSGFGNYYVIATGTNGCKNKSNEVNIYSNCGGGGTGTGGCTFATVPTVTVTSARIQHCGDVSVSVNFSSGNLAAPTFTWPTTATVISSTVVGSTATLLTHFNAAGSYDFSVSIPYPATPSGSCPKTVQTNVIVPLVPDLLYQLRCHNDSGFRVRLLNHSNYYNGTTNMQYRYKVDGSAYTTLSSAQFYDYPSGLSAGTHTLYMVVNYDYFDGTTTVNTTCSTSRVITVPPMPSASFSVDPLVPNPACEKQVAVNFINSSTGASTYNWLFGDGTSTTIPSPVFRTYATAGTKNVVLTAYNAYGCSSTANLNVSIHANELAGYSSVAPATICEGGLAALTFNSLGTGAPTNYTWMNGTAPIYTTTANPFYYGVTGGYWVHAFDQYGCYVNTDPSALTVLQVPEAVITGDSLQCAGNTFTLYGYAGSDPGISYQWTRNAGPAGNTPSIVQTLGAGNYQYQLTVTVTKNGVTCSKTSTVFTVVVHAPPAAPTISFNMVNCDPYQMTLTANPNTAGTYNWSNGASGNPVDVFVGGPYKVWYTDNYGCTVTAEQYTPKDPKGYLWIFPTGCYTACPPVNIPGPIIPFQQWAYYNPGGGWINSGSGYVPPLTLTSSGLYGMYLDDGYCKAQIDTLDFTADKKCGQPCGKLDVKLSIKYGPKCEVYPIFNVTNNYGTLLSYTITSSPGTMMPPTNTGVLNPGPNTLNTQWAPPTGFGSGIVTFTITVRLKDGTFCTTQVRADVKCPYGPIMRGTPESNASGSDIGLLSVAPNPANNTTQISYHLDNGNTGSHTLVVYDMTGRSMAEHTIAEKDGGRWTLDLMNMPSGIYQVVMKEEGRTIATTRLSVVR